MLVNVSERKNNNNEVNEILENDTSISIFFVEEKVCQKYPNLKLIKVVCNHDRLSGFYQTNKTVENDMYFYAFIEKDKYLKLSFDDISSKIPVVNINKLNFEGETIFKTRNDILKECTIFVQRSDNDDLCNDIVCIYPCVKKYYDESLLGNTKLLLASVSGKINQDELDSISLDILNNAKLETNNSIDNKITLYKNIREKIMRSDILTNEELEVLNLLIEEDINNVYKNTNILKYTLERKY